jgi:hypothetical protein
MCVAESAPFDLLSRAQAGVLQRTRTDGADRSLPPEASLLRQSAYPRLAGRPGASGEPQEGPALDASFCVDALGEAIETHGVPEIFNTDQGSQFTSDDFTGVLKRHGIRISMDGKGRWVDNVFVERLWRSVKYEEVYLKAYDGIAAARASLSRHFTFYNTERRHQSLDRRTPDSVYHETAAKLAA